MEPFELVLMIVGFSVASYAIVGNDAIQTLGTFLASNGKRPWWVLWAFSSTIMAIVLTWGWWTHGGDPAFGRLETYPFPQPFSWLYLIPPFVLLVLTRFGIPVSTTFLILTVFQVSNLGAMFLKSMLGYVVAFSAALVLYLVIARTVEKRFIDTRNNQPSTVWVALQWASTAYLWSMWLVQDLANIYVYLPRQLGAAELLGSLVVMIAIQAYIFYSRGGAVQRIVNSKTNTQDIRSAALINFMYGTILLMFKDGWITWMVYGQANKLPMSTTWVFLGLLAGRELAMNLHFNVRSWRDLGGAVGLDAMKAGIGLAASVAIALLLPYLAALVPHGSPSIESPAAVETPADPPSMPSPDLRDSDPPDRAAASGAFPELSHRVGFASRTSILR